MANYFLFTLDSKTKTLEFMQRNSSDRLGEHISLVFQKHSMGHSIRKQAPEPIPICLNGFQIGQFLGYHYDGNPTGFNNTAMPLIESSHVVFTVVDVDIGDLVSLKAGTLKEIITSFVEKADLNFALDAGFNIASENEQPFSAKPVFMNDTTQPVPLRILKTWPFRQGEECKMVYSGGSPFNFNEHFKPTRLASQLQV